MTVRHLLQLRCVCKSWCCLIDSLSFIKLHYQRSLISENVHLICLNNGEAYLEEVVLEQYYLVRDHECNDVLTLSNGLLEDYAPLFANPPDASSSVTGIGVVNGIICLQWRDKEIGLWNPATRDFKAIEYWLDLPNDIIGSTFWLMGFWFDSMSNDLKIVAGNYLRVPKLEKHYKVYSVSTETWKNLSGPPTGICTTRGISMNGYLKGVCYWPGYKVEHLERGGRRGIYLILAFDFVTEMFQVFYPPKEAIVKKEGCEFDWKIEVYMESIAVISSNANEEKGHGSVDIWIVSEIQGDSVRPLSWKHLFYHPTNSIIRYSLAS